MASGWWLVARSIAAVAAVVPATRYQIPATHLPRWPLREGLPKAVPYVRWIPGVLSTARTQENGESTFQPAGLFHSSTIYITEKRWMSKSFHEFNEKLTCSAH